MEFENWLKDHKIRRSCNDWFRLQRKTEVCKKLEAYIKSYNSERRIYKKYEGIYTSNHLEVDCGTFMEFINVYYPEVSSK